MRSSRLGSGSVALVLATVVVSGLGASMQRSGRRQAVYVLAVKDSGVLTMCPALLEVKLANGRTWKPDGRAIVGPFADDLQILRFPPRKSPFSSKEDPRLRTELSQTMAILPVPTTVAEAASPSASTLGTELGRDIMAMDPALKLAAERELGKLDTHVVADSVDGADLVLLIEGSYNAFVTSSTRDAIPATSDKPLPSLGSVAQAGDWQRNLLQSVLAILVPVEVYRASPGDIAAHLSARVWEGSEVAQSPYRVRERFPVTQMTRVETNSTWESASLEALVWQLAGKKPRPASHLPLCAASSQPFQVPGSTAAFTTGMTSVTLPVSVTDAAGQPIVGLDSSRFRVYEDDSPQAIDRVAPPGEPVKVALLVDTSSSMHRKAEETYAATVAAVNAFSRIGAVVMVSFDRRVMLHSTPPDNRDRFRPGVNQKSPTVGRTATRFYDAVDLLLTGPLKASSARSALVILTDGVDTASRLADAETARRRLGESHLSTYVIHYDTAQDNAPADQRLGLSISGRSPDLKPGLVPEDAADGRKVYARAAEFMRQITDISGGRLIVAPARDDLEKLFAEIAKELNQQYTVTYYPKNQGRDGTYRRIRVEVDRSDVNVRARPGYYQAPAGDAQRRY